MLTSWPSQHSGLTTPCLRLRHPTEYTCTTRRRFGRQTLSKDTEKARHLCVVLTLWPAQTVEWLCPLEEMVSCVYGMTAQVPPRSRVRETFVLYHGDTGTKRHLKSICDALQCHTKENKGHSFPVTYL